MRAPPEDPRVALIRGFRERPDSFTRNVLGGEPTPEQVAIMRSVVRYPETYVVSYHSSGKTRTAADLVCWFMSCFVPAKVITTAPTGRQVEALLWSEIRARHRGAVSPLDGVPMRTKWEISEDHFALGMSPAVENASEDQGVRFQGFHSRNLLLIFDEGPGVDPRLWVMKDAILTGQRSRFLGIGNPVAASGPFYDAWKRRAGNCIRMDIFKNPNFIAAGIKDLGDLTKASKMTDSELEALPCPYPALATVAWAARMLRKWGPESALFLSRVLSTFPLQAQDALVSLAWLEACARRPATKINNPVRALGIDVARFGSAKTVLCGIIGDEHVVHEVREGQDTRATTNLAIKLIRDKGFRAIAVDATGIGAGVVDGLVEWADAHPEWKGAIIPVENGGEASRPEEFVNLRAETYWEARLAFERCGVTVMDAGELFHQFTNIRYRLTAGGKIEIESKEKMSDRGMSSPDESDAFVLALHAWSGAREGISGAPGGGWVDRYLSSGQGRSREATQTPWRGL